MIPPVVARTWLAEHPEAVIADVRWSLQGPSGAELYAAGHIPGAIFVDLDQDLADPPSDQGGRHPMPAPERFAATLSALGITPTDVVVAYDDAGGFAAGRLVWMLRLLRVDAALLDGGIRAWQAELTTEETRLPASDFPVKPWPKAAFALMDEAMSGPVVLDARARERYLGEVEPTGVAAGHIPGAKSRPFSENLNPEGYFLSPQELRQAYAGLGITEASETICYCGSGVSACHNLIAMEYAGLGQGRLYVGSWSAYAISGQPIETGQDDTGGTPAP